MSQQDQQNEVTRFPIRELSARTKVNTVTIRAWERRYGLLTPERTSKGHRLYSDRDVVTIEKILALVARGVPLGKVKPLLAESETEETSELSDAWSESVDKLESAIKCFSSTRIEHLIDEYFLNYPPSVCREKLIEPALESIQKDDESKAALLYAESELIRYAVLRLNTKVTKKKGVSVLLLCGENTPLWRLALSAMELADAGFYIQLMTRPFTINACIDISAKSESPFIVFYQDGQWRNDEAKQISAMLNGEKTIMLVGTAAKLAGLEHKHQIFNDLGQCVRALLESRDTQSSSKGKGRA